ncbi:MAG TPA: helix-turn-helix domain-containing protein [Acidimicrobiales bacterium]|nr:helix-turn-helix domain-containing protein [Acidimicrobiales bacterium]
MSVPLRLQFDSEGGPGVADFERAPARKENRAQTSAMATGSTVGTPGTLGVSDQSASVPGQQQAATEIGPVAGERNDIEWVDIPELAARVGLAKESVYRLARSGRLRGAVRMGRRYVVNYSVFVEASKEPMTVAAFRS